MDLKNTVLLGDCLEILREVPDNTFHAVVTDPPYGLGKKEPRPEEILAFVNGGRLDTGGDFMNNDWDIPSVEVWKEVYRVLKPGGYVISFGGTRTFDLISLGLRMAGFESRDSIADLSANVLCWIHGQGMPKSHNIAKAIDKKLGVEREVLGYESALGPDRPISDKWEKNVKVPSGSPMVGGNPEGRLREITKPASEEAHKWEGYGTGLKPAFEPIVVFRKPFTGTIVANVLENGTGGINIDGCRVRHASKKDFEEHKAQVDAVRSKGGVRGNSWKNASDLSGANAVTTDGRWPPNALFTHHPDCVISRYEKIAAPVINRFDDGAKPFGGGAGHAYTSTQMGDENGQEEIPIWECVEECPVRELNRQSGNRPSTLTGKADPCTYHSNVYADSGGASRFFPQFQLKAPFLYTAKPGKKETTLEGRVDNTHPTRKPVALMRWLVRLVSSKEAHILDPYCGSGSTLHAAIEEGVTFTGIEKEPKFHKIASSRVEILLGEALKQEEENDLFDAVMELCDGD